MNHNKSLVEHLSELRDLLIVIEQGGEKTPDVLYKLAIEKSQTVAAVIEQRRICADAPQVEIPEEYALLIDSVDNVIPEDEDTEGLDDTMREAAVNNDTDNDESVSDVLNCNKPTDDVVEIEENILIDDTLMIVDVETPQPNEEADEQQQEYTESDNELPISVEEDMLTTAPASDMPLPVEDENPVIEVDVIEVGADDDDTLDMTDVLIDEAEEIEVMTDEVEVVDDSFDDVDDEVQEIEQDVDKEDKSIMFVDNEPNTIDDELDERELYNRGEPLESESSVLTVGEMMSARRAKELRKALGLNDRFRFRRELFGNSDVNMNDTLNLIDTMTDYAEARDYLINDLGWSADEPVVKEFLELVSLHFK